MSRPRLLGCALVLALLVARAAAAETLYVTERIEIGVHEDQSADSAILALVPSGSPLEVLVRDSGFAQVETGDGVVGWVDLSYLTSIQPPGSRLDTLNDEVASKIAALADAGEEIDSLRARLRDMEQRAIAAEAGLAAAIEAVESAPEPEPASAPAPVEVPKETLREMQRLAEENQDLKQRVAESEATERMLRDELTEATKPPPPGTAAPRPRGDENVLEQYLAIRHWKEWQWLLLGAGALLLFSLGAWIVDWRTRSRHGGFRV